MLLMTESLSNSYLEKEKEKQLTTQRGEEGNRDEERSQSLSIQPTMDARGAPRRDEIARACAPSTEEDEKNMAYIVRSLF